MQSLPNLTEISKTEIPRETRPKTERAKISEIQKPVAQVAASNSDIASLELPRRVDEQDISNKTLEKFISDANRALAPSFFRLNANVHEPTNTIMVRVVNVQTNEIVREIPPESRLDVIAKMLEFAGLLFEARG